MRSPAVVSYVRQSTLREVFENSESPSASTPSENGPSRYQPLGAPPALRTELDELEARLAAELRAKNE